MSSETLFRIQLVFGYVAWLLCSSVYIWPRLKAMDRFAAQRAIATLYSFRFFGLVFILPGIVGPALPAGFGTRRSVVRIHSPRPSCFNNIHIKSLRKSGR